MQVSFTEQGIPMSGKLAASLSEHMLKQMDVMHVQLQCLPAQQQRCCQPQSHNQQGSRLHAWQPLCTSKERCKQSLPSQQPCLLSSPSYTVTGKYLLMVTFLQHHSLQTLTFHVDHHISQLLEDL